ncbi:MAG TPA: hypothetical protein VIK81_00540 [Patescibacteria group bacterium]
MKEVVGYEDSKSVVLRTRFIDGRWRKVPETIKVRKPIYKDHGGDADIGVTSFEARHWLVDGPNHNPDIVIRNKK